MGAKGRTKTRKGKTGRRKVRAAPACKERPSLEELMGPVADKLSQAAKKAMSKKKGARTPSVQSIARS